MGEHEASAIHIYNILYSVKISLETINLCMFGLNHAKIDVFSFASSCVDFKVDRVKWYSAKELWADEYFYVFIECTSAWFDIVLTYGN